MSIVNKVKTVKAPTKPDKPKYYRDNNNFMEYETIEEIVKYAEVEDNECLSIKIGNAKNTIANSINLDVTQLDHCCGISEIGNLIVTPGVKETDLISMFDTISKLTIGHTFIVNTNGLGASLQCEKALVKCKQWTLVKTFKNSNSKNTIKIWISNNY